MSPPVRVLGPTEEQGSYPNTYKEEEGSQGFSLMGFLLGRKPGEGMISPTGGLPQGPECAVPVSGMPVAFPRRSKCLGPAGQWCLYPWCSEGKGPLHSGACTRGAIGGMTLVFPRHFQRQTHAQLGCLFLKHIQITVQEKKDTETTF